MACIGSTENTMSAPIAPAIHAPTYGMSAPTPTTSPTVAA